MRAIYTDADIIVAGDRLRSERPGGLVSAWDILKALGGRGKLDRVERIWSARLAEAVEVAAAPAVVETPLPPRLAEARDADLVQVATSLEAVKSVVANLYAGTWTIADEIAQGRVAAERKTFSDQRDEYERREALAREIQEAAELREEALELRADGLDADLAKSKTSETRLTERLAAAEADALKAAERSGTEIARLNADLAAASAAAAKAREDAVAAAATATAVQADAERARADLIAVRNSSKSEIDEIRRDRDIAQASVTQLTERLAAAEAAAVKAGERSVAEIARLKADLTIAEAATAKAREEAVVASATATAVQVEAERSRSDLSKQLTSMSEAYERERKALKVADGRLAEMSAAVARAEERVRSLEVLGQAAAEQGITQKHSP
jgi:chromosome segregation ATPase